MLFDPSFFINYLNLLKIEHQYVLSYISYQITNKLLVYYSISWRIVYHYIKKKRGTLVQDPHEKHTPQTQQNS